MQRVVMLAILAVLLLGAIGLQQIVAGWRYVLPADAGDLLYVATFDGFVDEWEQYDGRLNARISDGSLRLDVGDVISAPFSAASPHFRNFDVRIEAHPVEGPENNGYGLIFRLQDPDNHYLFMVSSDGYYKVSRRLNGEEKTLSDWIRTDIVQHGFGGTNWLRVVAYEDRFQFFINGYHVQLCIPDNPEAESTYFSFREECVEGQMKDTLFDDALASGRLGAMARSFDVPGVVVDFDNLVVFGPEIISESDR